MTAGPPLNSVCFHFLCQTYFEGICAAPACQALRSLIQPFCTYCLLFKRQARASPILSDTLRIVSRGYSERVIQHPKCSDGGRGRRAWIRREGGEWCIVGEQPQLSCRCARLCCMLLLQPSGRRPMGGGESVALEFSVSVRVAVCEGMGQCKHTHCTTAALPYFTFPNHLYLTHADLNTPLLSELNHYHKWTMFGS